MNEKITVLIVEKDPQITQLLMLLLSEPSWPSFSFTLVCVDGFDAVRATLDSDDSIQVVLLDPALSGVSLSEALRLTRRWASAIPVVVLVEPGGEAAGLEAVRAGAQDYQIKGSLDSRALKHALNCALVRQRFAPPRVNRSRHAHV